MMKLDDIFEKWLLAKSINPNISEIRETDKSNKGMDKISTWADIIKRGRMDKVSGTNMRKEVVKDGNATRGTQGEHAGTVNGRNSIQNNREDGSDNVNGNR